MICCTLVLYNRNLIVFFMSDDIFILMVNLAKLVAVNEYLREYGNKQICDELDSVVAGFTTVTYNLKQK